ncbi:CaiB/BaiF CoA transferase family protein [Nesterenkonia alkaliphila]|uniref:CoA transferase n=1 Tax=Nesterenkonia alkaliphila TaxID=1463631 RepID=A0A7K1UEM1_9MICC|nr:CoA transferase [Nesterenkonia alkaliphila]MVT24834.1 CoA transferase [Nesterenkonia alkaliphila]GFZ92902.1 CoA transferase [Nesterenkonia alkaliphila]
MILEGVRVLDLSRLVAGNQLSLLLADFGADVIKAEAQGSGDTLRNWRTLGVETYWKTYARNKRSIEVNLKDDRHLDTLKKLVTVADVIIDSFKPGDMDKFGLSDSVLREINPSLIIVHISGWGRTGSRATMPGFGTLIEAASGMADRTGDPDGPPQLPPGAFADMVAGTFGAFAVAAALYGRSADHGEVIDLSLFEPLFAIMGPQAADYALTGEAPRRLGSRLNSTAPRNVYQCKDGKWVALSGSTQAMTERLFRAIGQDSLIEDPRFATNSDRVKNVEELDDYISQYFSEHEREEALNHLMNEGVTVGPVSNIGELASSEYFESREILVGEGENVMHNIVPRLQTAPGKIYRPAPTLGQHTREVISEVNNPDEVEDYMARLGK